MYPTILFSSDPRCETTDIVMLLDESGSISPADFNTMKSFVAKIVSGCDIGPDKVQIGNMFTTVQTNTVYCLCATNTRVLSLLSHTLLCVFCRSDSVQ